MAVSSVSLRAEVSFRWSCGAVWDRRRKVGGKANCKLNLFHQGSGENIETVSLSAHRMWSEKCRKDLTHTRPPTVQYSYADLETQFVLVFIISRGDLAFATLETLAGLRRNFLRESHYHPLIRSFDRPPPHLSPPSEASSQSTKSARK